MQWTNFSKTFLGVRVQNEFKYYFWCCLSPRDHPNCCWELIDFDYHCLSSWPENSKPFERSVSFSIHCRFIHRHFQCESNNAVPTHRGLNFRWIQVSLLDHFCVYCAIFLSSNHLVLINIDRFRILLEGTAYLHRRTIRSVVIEAVEFLYFAAFCIWILIALFIII